LKNVIQKHNENINFKQKQKLKKIVNFSVAILVLQGAVAKGILGHVSAGPITLQRCWVWLHNYTQGY
jgi:ABC-type methionine transport system ATPase subunit